MNSLDGRVAVVTGASSGIGRATAELLASRGARVTIFSRRSDALAALAREAAGRMFAVAGDVADADAVERLFFSTEEQFGPCDILVNAAGIIDPKPVAEMTEEQWERMFAVNARGTFLTCRRALRPMIARRSGAIINIGSISGVPGPQKFPGYSSYCAAKAAVIAFTESLAVEVAEYGIRANCVSPGSVDTPMLAKVGGLTPDMTPEEVAEIILFLASEASRPINGKNIQSYGV